MCTVRRRVCSPGGPCKRTPRQAESPRRWKESACSSGHTIACCNRCFTSSSPPMSSHLTAGMRLLIPIRHSHLHKILHHLFKITPCAMWAVRSGRRIRYSASGCTRAGTSSLEDTNQQHERVLAAVLAASSTPYQLPKLVSTALVHVFVAQSFINWLGHSSCMTCMMASG